MSLRRVIAEVRLAPGQVGYYDEHTNIHLTLTKPMDVVYSDMNTSGLQRSVNSKRLILVSGSLQAQKAPLAPEPVKVEVPKTEPVKVETPVAVEPVKEAVEAEEVLVSAGMPVVEEVAEAVAEEIIVEEAVVAEEAPKVTNKKKGKKAETPVEE